MLSKYRKILIFGLIIYLIFFIISISSLKKYENITNARNGIIKIVSSKQEKEYKNKYIIEFNKNRYLLYTDKKDNFDYGDIVYFNGKFEKIKSSKNFKLFDYARFLRQQKIYGVLEYSSLNKIGQEKDISYYLEKVKSKLENNIYEVFDEKKAGFLSGLLLGDKGKVFDETLEDFRNSSLSHILALSGLHIIYVSIGIRTILDLITPKQKLKNLLMIFILMFFAVWTGESPSCLRACIMCSMVYLSKIFYRKNDFYISLLFSLDVILIINCYNIEGIGLWLSYFSTFGMVYIGNNFSSKNSIFESIKISIICNVMIIPIIWNCYNKISLIFIISNLFVSYLIGPIIILGYIHLFFGKISIFFSFFENYLLDFVFGVAKKIGKLKYSNILVPSLPVFGWIVYYVIIIGIIYLCNNKDLFKKFQKKIILFIISLLLSILVFIIPTRNDFEIHFLDVGQGDSSLIITPQKQVILIDGGNNEGYDNGENIVGPYLLKNGFNKVDYMIVSHR